ncbi:NAD(P)-binding protein [Byssothecium circinans]|uniref:NAD(P)-binding protein n=1 Tax=Byssothecium circinans TaxID=147558 RepID=A0A6A5TFA5_9PLEO|nr:NAD(P)-binding protein [Byssothecium circinans]
MNEATVLVTGGAGIVGSHVLEHLSASGRWGKVVATYHSAKVHQHSCEGVEYHVCDISDGAKIDHLLDVTRPKIIIHTVSPGPFAPSAMQHKINYMATRELLERAKTHPSVHAFIYTSSLEAVDLRSGSKDVAETEDESQLNDLTSSTGISAYGRTKGAADALVLAANTGNRREENSVDFTGQLLTLTLRIGGLYGERDLKTIWEMLKCGNTPATRFQIGPDKTTHEWVYTTNVAQAHILAAEALLDGKHMTEDTKVDGEAYFITDDSPMRFWEFSRRVWLAAGDKYLTSTEAPRIIQIPFWIVTSAVSAGESIRKFLNMGNHDLKLSSHHLQYMKVGCRVSVEKAKIRLGYKPVCDTEEGITKSVAWFMQKENEVWFKV